MEFYTLEQKKYIIKCYHREHSIREIVNLFQTTFAGTISYETVRRMIKNFEVHGCLYPDRHRRNFAPQNEERDILICAAVEEQPRLSSRVLAEQLDVSDATVRKVLKRNKYRAYKLRKSNEIFPEDEYKRLKFCEDIRQRCNENENFVKNILFSDESTFPLHGHHNPSIAYHWSRENNHVVYDAHTQYPQKVNVWAGLLGSHIIGPFFITGNLNAQGYLNLLQSNVVPALQALEDVVIDEIWFQQDGCPAHNTRIVREYLRNIFGDRLIAGWSTICWPPRSPDLAPNDFFLWGFVKSSIYKFQDTRANNLEELTVKISDCFRNINPEMLANVQRSFYNRLGYCSLQFGDRFEHLV